MRILPLVVVVGLVGCVGEAPLEASSSPTRPLNQFRQREQALTLSDGGLCPITVDPNTELMIRAVPVVEDPIRTRWTGVLTNPSDGAWSFGRLMTEMAGANDPEVFVRNWLTTWDTTQTVNGLPVAPRNMAGLVTTPWLQASGGARLDLRNAPFRLLAIVNRMDLRDLSRGSAGEGRFVFGVLDRFGNQTQFTVIFEYNLPASTQADVDRWAADWHALGTLPVGSPQYNTALEAITRRFSARGAAATRPNGSALNQLRTNEIALQAPWEMREFTLSSAGQLVLAPVAQTTDLPINNSPTLAQFINQNTASILTATHVVPAQFNGQPFLAGSSLVNPGHFWNAPGITNPEARFQFSVNTCSGCHAGDTQTAFLHVFPRNVGQQANLSGFLTGITVRDPVSGQQRTLNDLAVRSESLLAVLCREPSTPQGPSVRITAPAAGASVRGQVPLSAEITGRVDAVQFLVDGAPVGPAVPPPFNSVWNADTTPPGQHTLTATGLTPTGPIQSAPISVTVLPSSAPDFTANIVSAPAIIEPGGQLVVSVEACNRGNLFGFTEIEVGLSADAVFSLPPDAPVGLTPVALNAGECRTVEIRGPANPPPGTQPPTAGEIGTRSNLIAMADRRAMLIELDETNNSSQRPLIIGRGPDFTVTHKAPANVQPGPQFTTNVTVCNAGNMPGSTEIEVIASTDTTITTPPDLFIGFNPRVFLTVGQCQTIAVTTQAPPGSQFIAARATRGDPELSVANNVSTPTMLNVGFLADFTISSVSAPAALLPGATFTASVTICNEGTVPAPGNATLVLTASRTFTFPSPTVTPFATTPFVNIEPGRCVLQLFTGTAPTTTRSVFIGAVADGNNGIPEFNETNNQNASASPILIGALPDFTVTGLSVPANALLPGTSFSSLVSVCNRGTVSGTTDVQLRLDGAPAGQARVTLAANACVATNVTGVAQPSMTNIVQVTGVADPLNTVVELSETNNTSPAVQLAVGFGPDFVVSALVTPNAIEPGASFSATVTACNRGTQPGSAPVDLFVSTDSNVTTTDFRLSGLPFALAAGECKTQIVQTRLSAPLPPPTPPSLGTTVFIGAIADPDSFMNELRENNNVGGTRSVIVGFGADFQIAGLGAPATVTLGSQFNVTVSVCNRGTQRAVANVTLLLSQDAVVPQTHPIASNDSFITVPGATSFDLAAGACESRSLPAIATPPQGLRGAMFLGAIVDLDQNVFELNEGNNSLVRSITVQ